MLKMLLVLADWERDLLRERTREGVARARAAGKRPGPRPKLSDEQISAVRAAVAGRETVSAVARSFGVSRQTAYMALDGAGRAARATGGVAVGTRQVTAGSCRWMAYGSH